MGLTRTSIPSDNRLTISTVTRLNVNPEFTPAFVPLAAWWDASDASTVTGTVGPECEVNVINTTTANGGINPATGQAWKAGDQYRIVFACDSIDALSATSNNINDYNTHIMRAASSTSFGDLTKGGTLQWTAMGSTSSVNIRTNCNLPASATNIPVLRTNSTVCATNYTDLFDGSPAATISYNKNGALVSNGWTTGWATWTAVWTGTNNDGTTKTGYELGATNVGYGLARDATGFVFSRAPGGDPNTYTGSLYGISPVLTLQPFASGTASQWNDKSGRGLHATQGTAANQPIYTAIRKINNLNTMQWIGTDRSFNFTTTNLISGKEVWTVFSPDVTNTTDGRVIVLGHSGNSQVYITPLPGTPPPKMRLWAGTSAYTADTYSTTTFTSGANYFVGFLTHNPKKFSINGTLQTTTDVYAASNPIFSVSRIGRSQFESNSNGIIGEIIITAQELSTQNRQKMEGYLAWKWGLVSNLPSDHPYKNRKPYASE